MKTKGGQEVVHLQYVPKNSIGATVTFPLKGTIIRRRKPLKTEFQIWTRDGRASVFEETEDDLVMEGDLAVALSD